MNSKIDVRELSEHVVDLVNSGNTISFIEMKKIREQTKDIWDKTGLLQGLKGHVKDSIAYMYECCATSTLTDVDITGDTTDLTVYKKD